jgi:hypothetical protein
MMELVAGWLLIAGFGLLGATSRRGQPGVASQHRISFFVRSSRLSLCSRAEAAPSNAHHAAA